MEWTHVRIKRLIETALDEDIGTGDLTSEATVPPDQHCLAEFIVKAEGVIAGLPLLPHVFRQLDAAAEVAYEVEDGTPVQPGQVVARVRGRTRAILSGERVALNFLQRLSGVASKTARAAALLEGSGVRLLDTRKTTPGLRVLEKYAVRVGGGTNHRFGLYDAVLIKENHIDACGGVSQALERVRQRTGHMVSVSIEVTTLRQLEEALEAGADRLLLDNMSPGLLAQAVELVQGRALLEASGGVNEETLPAIAQTGVDLVSMGGLTHSAPALDISLIIAEAFPGGDGMSRGSDH